MNLFIFNSFLGMAYRGINANEINLDTYVDEYMAEEDGYYTDSKVFLQFLDIQVKRKLLILI